MPKQIRTFKEFIRHIVWLILWVVGIAALIGLPVAYLAYAFLGVRSLGLLSLMVTDPSRLIQFSLNLLHTEPYASLFAFTTFPGFTFVSVFSAVLMIYLERKLIAKMQLRVGPQYAGRWEGILQTFADLFKLLFKEIIVPYKVDKPFFWAVPFMLMAIAGGLVALVPVGPTTYISNSSVGAIFIFAVLGFTPLVALLAGWASNSKYSFLGGLRALHQMVSYEIPMILSVLGVVVLSGSLNLISIVDAQSGLWYIFLQPLGAIVFFITAIAELERIPFDLPEADSELVSGWQTEYSGMLFGIFQLGTYVKFYAIAGLFTIFFLGGWAGLPVIPPPAWFVIKVFIVMVAMMVPRGVMGRVRIDLLLRTGWAKLMFVAFLNIFLAMLLVSLGIGHAGVA